MPKSLRSKRHRAPNYIAKTETGERRLDTVEFFDVADALGVDPIVLFTRIANW